MDEILPFISPFYKKDDARKIIIELTRYLQTLKQPELLPLSPSWYKNCLLYVIYPEAVHTKELSPLENIKAYLPTIKDLGCNAVHLLPFLSSPMKDKGFDVEDYFRVREGLGGMEALRSLKKEANTLGLHMFMDLIFNHVSDTHEWFIKAQTGNEFYRNFFIHTSETPQFLGKIYKKSAVYAEYLINGEKEMVSVAFPEFAGELPHWVKGKDGYWYYHTYYPNQIDLNWQNPDVFIELMKVLLYWASEGFNFRLDAIPFIGKPAYKHLNTHNAFTHHLTAVFHVIARQINPQCVFILETYEHLDAEIEYFGTANRHQAHLLYSFHLTTALWITILEKDVAYTWRQLKKNAQIPIHAQWVNFLRNHDELSFGYTKRSLIEKEQKKMLGNGKSFRDGYGIAGKTFSLLGSDEMRFLMAYFFLFSLPGSILIPYGDEYGMENVSETKLSESEQLDARNIGRGIIRQSLLDKEKSKRIFEHFKHLITIKSLMRDYFATSPKEMQTPKGVFGAIYTVGTSVLIILVNLTNKNHTITFDSTSFEEVANVNIFTLGKGSITLGPYGGVWLQK